uniref:Uncharacterized protein n=1 Tax=Cucumis sativus TaxID=3659 RepID=A0A0A0KI09_CUCSA
MVNAFEFSRYYDKEKAMDDSPMDLDPKSKNKQVDHHLQSNDREWEQKAQDLIDNQLEDHLKIRKEVDQDLHPSHPPVSSKMANLVGRERKDREAESCKRMRMTESSSDPSAESLKLIEEIVKMYGKHVDHLIREVRNGVKDDMVWSFNLHKYGVIDETFGEKVRRLGCELERMKHDEKQYRDYIYIEPRIMQIMTFMLKVHEIFDPHSKGCEKEKQKCYEMCSLDRYRREVDGMRWRVEMLKDLKTYRKEEEEIRRFFKF